MRFHELLNRRILLPMADFVGKTKILQKRKFLLKSQWWSKEEIQEFQLKKLKRIVNHAYNNVPFYRESFKKYGVDPSQIQKLSDIEKLPILRRSDIRNNLQDMIARNIDSSHLVRGRTAGSTGEPLQFHRDTTSKSWAWGCMHRFFNWTGLRFGESVLTISGGSLGGFLVEKTTTSRIFSKGKGWMGNYNIPAFPLRDSTPSEINSITASKRLRCVRAYPSVLFAIAKSAESQGIRIEGIDLCLTTAEVLYPHWRKKIEEIFSAPIYDQYGCGEIHSIAAQCDAKELHHSFDEHVLVENPSIGIGDYGFSKAIITNLDNYGTPFIRYENGDVLSFSNETCSCSRNLTSISEVMGRSHDFLISTNGLPVAGKFILLLFMRVRGFNRYFVHQTSGYRIEVSIVKNEHYTSSEVATLISKMKEALGEDMTIEFIPVDTIEEPSSMKYSCVKSEVKFF